MSRTREAPTPTNISTKSEPEMVKKGTLASPAMARASSVLPVPGEPTMSTPFGILPPSFWNLPGSFRKSTISETSCFASSTPGDVGEGDVDLILAQEARAALAEGHRAATSGCALHLPQHIDEDHDQEQRRGKLQAEAGRQNSAASAAGPSIATSAFERAPIRAVKSVSGL